MENRYSSDEVLIQLFMDSFGISEEDSSGEDAEGTYTYHGIKWWFQIPWQLWEALFLPTV